MYWPNDWRLRDCLWACGGLTLLQIILVVLSQFGIDIPVIRQVSGFLFLTFVPGILLLRILGIRNVNAVESVVYSAGLSLALLMFTGAVTNIAFPLIGIRQPLLIMPVTICLAALSAILLLLAWLRERRTTLLESPIASLRPGLHSILVLALMLLLVILGVKVSDLTGNNLVIIFILLCIAAIFGLGVYKKFFKPPIYPLVIFIVSLCLLYQTSLMTPYMVGTDIYPEYQFFRIAASSGVWNYAIPSTINSCLSIVILAPYYSSMMGISGIWVFKAVYPLVFSLMPLAMYRFFRIQVGETRSFIATFFFLAVPTFSLELVSLCRQQVAELFMALLILLLVDRKIAGWPKLAMLMLFSAGLVVSHYSLGFIVLIYMGLLLVLILLMKRSFFPAAWAWLTRRSGGLPDYMRKPGSGSLPLMLLASVAVFYFVFAFAWYGLTSSGINFGMLAYEWSRQTGSAIQMAINAFTHLGGNVALTPAVAQSDSLVKTALGLDFWRVSWQGMAFRLLQYITELFLVAGLLRLLLRPRGLKFRLEYIALSVTSVLLLIACVLLPYFATVFNASRWYHILLITLAPFVVLGGEGIVLSAIYLWRKIIGSLSTVNWESVSVKALPLIAVIVFIPYFIFTSGIVYEVTGQKITDRIDDPYSLALSNHRLNLAGVFNRQDEAAAEWLCGESAGKPLNVFTDADSYKMLLLPDCFMNWSYIPLQGMLPTASYLYLTSWNTQKDSIAFSQTGKPGLRTIQNLADVAATAYAENHGDKIYLNGGSAILLGTK
ncbi:MAG: DUF2206 domain-containing protein [Dehalococcoidia bacterium]